MSPVHRTLTLLALLLLAACSGSGRDLPEPEEFTAGTCRDAAPAVIALDEQVRRAVESDADTADVRAILEAEQSRLIELLDETGSTADGPDVADELEEIVTRVGFARASINIDAIGEEEVRDVTTAVDDLVAVCVPSNG